MWGDGDAGWEGAGFCCLLCLENIRYNKKFNSIKNKPSSDLSVALDVFLSSLKCEMNGISQGRGVYIVSGRVGNMLPACLFVITAFLFVIWFVC